MIYTQPVTGGVGGTITAQEYEIDGGSGRIGVYYRPSTTYAYQLTDHLGNVRAVVAKNGTTLQVRLYNDYYPYGMVVTPQTYGTNDYRYGYQGQYAEKDPETDWNAFELRMYDAKIARWLSVDPAKQFHSPYVSMGNNPVSGVDPDGGETKDWVLRADNSIYWDPNANSQATTKKGEIYLGKDFVIDFSSYIDKNLWDGPNPWFDVSGTKLQSLVQVIGTENSNGELTGISTRFHTQIHTNKGGFKGEPYEGFPDIERSTSFFGQDKSFAGFTIALEKHARVPLLERAGLLVQGFQDVNVAQRLDILYVGKNLNISFKTDVFPSTTGKIFGSGGFEFTLMQYDQPSYRNTHSLRNGLLPYHLYQRN